MLPSCAERPGLFHVGPTSRFASEVMFRSASNPGSSVVIVSGGTVGGGGPADVVESRAVRCDDVDPPSVAHPASATTANRMNTYDSVTPTRARSRPSSPVRRIRANPRCPRTAPAGANTNANTSDSVARVLTAGRYGGVPGGSAGGSIGSIGSIGGTRPSGS